MAYARPPHTQQWGWGVSKKVCPIEKVVYSPRRGPARSLPPIQATPRAPLVWPIGRLQRHDCKTDRFHIGPNHMTWARLKLDCTENQKLDLRTFGSVAHHRPTWRQLPATDVRSSPQDTRSHASGPSPERTRSNRRARQTRVGSLGGRTTFGNYLARANWSIRLPLVCLPLVSMFGPWSFSRHVPVVFRLLCLGCRGAPL